ncbi:MAG: NUDIX domain-containing protein [Bacilli bacterium]|nr:NUDIX domain-containing protein [Bacilli bacterium]
MKDYKTEEEFLKDYNPNAFAPFSVTTDILILSVSNEVNTNYRKLNEKHFSVLLIKRNNYPYKDKWCLPGGFVGEKETLEDAAARVLETETNLRNIYMEQLYTFGNPQRDPRMRVISTSYMALVDKNRLRDTLGENASWFTLNIMEEKDSIDVILDNGNEQIKFTVGKSPRHMTTDRDDFTILKNDALAFDHPLVIVSGIERLKNKIEYTDIVFNMMPEYFSLGDLQQVYEIILGKKLLDPAFRRIIANKVEKTKKVKTGAGHRPSALFKYKGKK